MKYAEKYSVSRASRKYNQVPVLYLLLAGSRGWECKILDLSVPASSQPSKPAYRSRAEANPRYAVPQSTARSCGVVAPPETAQLCRCITDPELRLFQYTAIDEFSWPAYPEQATYSSADFLKQLAKLCARIGIRVECV